MHSARFFYWPNLKPDRQLSTAADGLRFDPHGLIAYEGLRKCDYNRTGLPEPHCEHGEGFGPYGEADTTGDVCKHRGITPANGSAYAACEVVGRSCTLGIYGGIFVGALGRVVTPTNVTGVLMIDAVATDIFPTGKPNPTWTIYNPHDETAYVEFNTSALGVPPTLLATGFDLIDLISSRRVASCGGAAGAHGCTAAIGADSALVVEAIFRQSAGPKTDDDARIQLNSSVLQVEVTVGANASSPTWLSSLKVNQRPAWDESPSEWTGNIVVGRQQWGGPQYDVQNGGGLVSWSTSGTGIYSLDDSLDGSEVHGYTSRGGRVTQHNATSLTIDGILVGPADTPWATERWIIWLGGTFSWAVRRTFTRAVHVIADKSPALVLPHTQPHGRKGGQYTASSGPQTVSFLDEATIMNGTGTASGGFWITTHGGNFSWMQVVSPEREQLLRLSPSGMALKSTQSAGLFSFANAQCQYNVDGPCCALVAAALSLTSGAIVGNLVACVL